MGKRQKRRANLPEINLERAGGLEETRGREAIDDFEEAGDLKKARDPDKTEDATEII